jgi:hypothetical protein
VQDFRAGRETHRQAAKRCWIAARETIPPNVDLRAAIIKALDERAAVLHFTDPTPFRSSDLKRIKEGIVAFSRLAPRTAFVGVIMLGACIIAVQVFWGAGRGLGARTEYAVTEVGKILVDELTARLRETNSR